MPIPEDVYYAAQKLLPYLSSDVRAGLSRLLALAELGNEISSEVVDFLAEQGDDTRDWMRSAIYGANNAGTDQERYAPLAGRVGSVGAHRTWICPKQKGHFEWYVREAGMPVPPCPKHKVKLVLATKRKENSNAR